jgi:hypothetical protein
VLSARDPAAAAAAAAAAAECIADMPAFLESSLVFALVWGLGGVVDTAGRALFSDTLRALLRGECALCVVWALCGAVRAVHVVRALPPPVLCVLCGRRASAGVEGKGVRGSVVCSRW